MMLRNWARLYTKPTLAEQTLEPAIAALGERYRAQHPFFSLYLIADFVLLDSRVVIEVDGKSHSTPAQIRKDLQHMIALEERGWAVIRVTNEQVMANPGLTLSVALNAVHSRPGVEKLREMLSILPPAPTPKRRKVSRPGGRKQRKPGPGPDSPAWNRLAENVG